MTLTSPKWTTWLTCIAVLSVSLGSLAAPPTRPKKPKNPPADAAVAPGKPRKPPAAGAKRHLLAGQRALKTHKYEVAIRELELAFKLSPKPSTLKLVGDAYFANKSFVSSYNAYETLLAEHADSLSPRDKADAEKNLQTLGTLTAQVEITSNQQGAAILIDGESAGVTPLLGPVRVTVGTHKIRATTGTLDPVEQSVELAAGEKHEVALNFAGADDLPDPSTTAGLHVSATPPEATVEVDGKDVGTGSFDGDLSAGKHRLVVRAQGFESSIQELTLEAGQTTSRDIKLGAEHPVVDEVVAEAPQTKGPGVYGMAAGFAALPIAGQSTQPCPPIPPGAPAGFGCSRQFQYGGGLVVHVGYSWTAWSVEFTGAFFGERHTEKKNIAGYTFVENPEYLKGNIARNEIYTIYSVGGFIGLGPRFTTRGESLRFSFGLSPGLSLRSYTLDREVGGAVLDSYKTGASATTFGLLGDASVVIGKAGTFKVIAGLMAWIDTPSSVDTPSGDPHKIDFQYNGAHVETVLPTPSYTLAQGMQIFVGPQVGAQF